MDILASQDWTVSYDVSAGMDVRQDGKCTQEFNPFHGDVVAPKTWFGLGNTEGMMCAHTAEECLIFVFEYVKDSGFLIDTLAAVLGVPALFYGSLQPASVWLGDVCNGLRGEFSGVKFPRPVRVTKPYPSCCEIHAVLAFASKCGDPYFAPLLESKTSTSGHLDVRFLSVLDVDGGWEPFVDAWDSGIILARMNVPQKIQKSKS
jgi:hypothetical protein